MVAVVKKAAKVATTESKTARASRPGAKAPKFVKLCKECNGPMVATMKFTETGRRMGMFWICSSNHEVRT
jgi:hypothetical protein